MSAGLRTSQKTRQRRRTNSGKYRIRVRYKYHYYRTINTEDYGTFREMHEKYGNKYQFWCADVPPTTESENGSVTGVRLDSDVFDAHTEASLSKYGQHKCWIDPDFKVDGKTVCLVYNAADESFIYHIPANSYRKRIKDYNMPRLVLQLCR